MHLLGLLAALLLTLVGYAGGVTLGARDRTREPEGPDLAAAALLLAGVLAAARAVPAEWALMAGGLAAGGGVGWARGAARDRTLPPPGPPDPGARLRDRWTAFAGAMGHFQSHLLLAAVYLVAVGPVALLARPFSDPFAPADPDGGSNWHADEPAASDGEDPLDAVRRQY